MGTEMDFIQKNRRYSILVLGYVCFGLGQKLLETSVLVPMAQAKRIDVWIGSIGSVLFTLGSVCLFSLLGWFVKYYNQNHSVLKIFGLGVLASLSVGFVIGLSGQLVYNHTSIGYEQIKYGIWSISTLCQLIIKLMVLFQLWCVYQGRACTFQDSNLQKSIWVCVLVWLGLNGIGLLVPQILDIGVYLMDSVLILGTVYTFMIKK